jgi:hypothetical protein
MNQLSGSFVNYPSLTEGASWLNERPDCADSPQA